MIKLTLTVSSLIVAVVGCPVVSEAAGQNDRGYAVAAEHCTSCHALPGEADTGIAASLEELIDSQPVWTDIDLRMILPRQHGAKASIILTSEEARDLGGYLQSIKNKETQLSP